MARKKAKPNLKVEELFDADITEEELAEAERIAQEEANHEEEAIPLAEKETVEEETPQGETEFVYDEAYFIDGYREKNGHPYGHTEPWLSFFGTVALRLRNLFNPTTVLDVGCATGILVNAFNKQSTSVKASGIDISEWAIENAPEKVREHLTVHDVRKPFPKRGFDLVTCIEVLEHVPAEGAPDAVRNLCAAVNDGGFVVFSSSPSDVDNPSHANVQNEDYWLELFAAHGFTKAAEYQVGFITPHAIVLRK